MARTPATLEGLLSMAFSPGGRPPRNRAKAAKAAEKVEIGQQIEICGESVRIGSYLLIDGQGELVAASPNMTFNDVQELRDSGHKPTCLEVLAASVDTSTIARIVAHR